MAKTKNTRKFFGIRQAPFKKQQAKPDELPKAPVFAHPEKEIIGDPIIISDSESEEDPIIISDDEDVPLNEDSSEESERSYECDPPSDVELPGESDDDEERQEVIRQVFAPTCCPSDGPFPPKCENIRLWSIEERLCKHCGIALSDAQHARAHEIIEHGGLCQCGHYRYTSFRDYHSHVKDCIFRPVFNCPFEHCGEAFRSIYEQFHHMTHCDEGEHPTGNRRFIFMGRRVSRIPSWYKDSDEESGSEADTSDDEE